MRQIVLDTETTGLEPGQGHRIIEIGCVELEGRRHTKRQFHCYLHPDRAIDQGALEVHGITLEFLADKPRFRDVANEFLEFISGAELVIHNAGFDVAFLNAELARVPGLGTIESQCEVIDTLAIARTAHPGQRNSLDALCTRYEVDNSQRELHGALLDAEILADVYLAMTGGQATLALAEPTNGGEHGGAAWVLRAERPALRVINADATELERHDARLAGIDEVAGAGCLWLKTGVQPSL
jgi:DNA polymerase-3 subunit epsilon